MATITINCKSTLSFLSATSPRIIIDGQKFKGSMSRPNIYEISSGTHRIKVYLPYPIFMFPTSVAEAFITVVEGDQISFRYRLPIFIFLSGKLELDSHINSTQTNASAASTHNEKRSHRNFLSCPQCKNPNTKGTNVCEWCGAPFS